MTHNPSVNVSTSQVYRCPGEHYWIDRAVHLGRLAALHAACRHCQHRHDTGGLTSLQRIQLAELDRHTQSVAEFHAEGLAGVAGNQLSTSLVRDAALAMGICIQQAAAEMHVAGGISPPVMLGCDGRPITAELVAAASEGLRRAGCTAIEIGAANCGSMIESLARFPGSSGLLVGNPGGEPHYAGLRFWGPDGIAWSAAGQLDELARLLAVGASRPVRHFGGVERKDLSLDYLAGRIDLFHALRPLRLIVSTVSPATMRFLEHLLRPSACEIRLARQNGEGVVAADLGRRPAAVDPADTSWRQRAFAAHERRLVQLGRQIVQENAHLGVWIDGDGDCLQLFDEQGRAVSSQRLMLGLARATLDPKAGNTVVLESSADERTVLILREFGAHVIQSAGTREAMTLSMRESAAVFGGGPSGRIWWSAGHVQKLTGTPAPGGSPPVSDVLLTLGVLLNLLSQSDRPLSEVLDAA